MTDHTSRREELIAAALADELDEQERREFDQASAADPSMLRDLHEVRETTAILERAEATWREEDPPPELEHRILAAIAGETASETPGQGAEAGSVERSPANDASPQRGRRAALLGLAAAGFTAMGATGGILIDHRRQAPPEGPPGTLGAVEEVPVEGVPSGASINVSLVAHTWGTETVLEIDGLGVGDTFEAVLVRDDGQEMSSGTFLGSELTITCRLNAAVLRERVVEVRIQDGAGSAVVASRVPEV